MAETRLAPVMLFLGPCAFLLNWIIPAIAQSLEKLACANV